MGVCEIYGPYGGLYSSYHCVYTVARRKATILRLPVYHSNNFQERNFLRNQSGMRKQLVALDHLIQLMDPKLYLHLQSANATNLFFFFRMLLVWYKREFEWPDVLRLWEVLWTDYLSSSFHLFIALAILEKHRDVIMDHLKHFDEILKYSKCIIIILFVDQPSICREARSILSYDSDHVQSTSSPEQFSCTRS